MRVLAFGGFLQGFVAFDYNSLPTGKALLVVKKSKTVPFHDGGQPSSLADKLQHLGATEYKLGVLNSCCPSPGLNER